MMLENLERARLHALSFRTFWALFFVRVETFKISTKYFKRYETVLLVLHAKGSRLTYAEISRLLRKIKVICSKEWAKVQKSKECWRSARKKFNPYDNVVKEYYQKCLLISAEKFYGKNKDNGQLQEDNDPKHWSFLCIEWKTENSITTMNWPASSPDANQIENMWSYIKYKLRGKPIFILKQLPTRIKKLWCSLPYEYVKKFIESIIDNSGDWTYYSIIV